MEKIATMLFVCHVSQLLFPFSYEAAVSQTRDESRFKFTSRHYCQQIQTAFLKRNFPIRVLGMNKKIAIRP